MSNGPLEGLKVIELAGLGPGPFATMLLGDMGAEVIRVDRPGPTEYFEGKQQYDLLNRGKRSIALNLKRPEAVEILLNMTESADVLIEGFRPGVVERLGLGPEPCLARNPRLVYGRMTGWGQEGPLSQTAGHDINYIAITGALASIGAESGPPQPPLNLLGDFGGGGMYLVAGVLAALLRANRTGEGEVIDAAISDGVAHLFTAIHGQMAAGMWEERRASNMVDGGAPYYSVYETADSQYVAVGAIEAAFYAELLRELDVDLPLSSQHDRNHWPEARSRIAEAFASKSLDHWAELFAESDACVSPIVSPTAAHTNRHMAARGSLGLVGGVLQAGPAPRFLNAPSPFPRSTPPLPGEHTREILSELGLHAERYLEKGIASSS